MFIFFLAFAVFPNLTNAEAVEEKLSVLFASLSYSLPNMICSWGPER